jgi:hypothetical protein
MKTRLAQLIALMFIIMSLVVSSQTVVISDDENYTTGEASAVLDLKSIERGLIISRMTAIQREGINQPVTGLLVFQTDEPAGFYYNAGTAAEPSWKLIRIIENDDVTAWNQAFSWGDHSEAGYLTEESDPLFNASAASGITNDNITIWNEAYSWGDHALAGYAQDSHVHETLSLGIGLTGGNYNGSAPTTWAVDFDGTGLFDKVARSDHFHSGMTTGSGAENKLAFWTGTSTLGSNEYLHWNNANGLLGIGSSNPVYPLTVVSGYLCGIFSESLVENSYGIIGYNSSPTGINYGVAGESVSPDGLGIFGLASSATGLNFGVYGKSQSSQGYGLFGLATATEGANYGVAGRTESNSGYAVFGLANSATGANYGVVGHTKSTEGFGVFGHATATNGVNYGVVGRSESQEGYGVVGINESMSGSTVGVMGLVNSFDGYSGYFAGGRFFMGSIFGLGVINPTAQLHTSGTVRFANYSNGFLKVDNNGNLSTSTSSQLFTAGNGLNWSGSTLNSVWTQSGNSIYSNNNGNVGIGVTNPTAQLHVAGTVDVFGPWASFDWNTTYTASTDGFVVANIAIATGDNANAAIFGKTDGLPAPATVRGRASVRRIAGTTYSLQNSFTIPVRKGDKWRVDIEVYDGLVGNLTGQVFWMPLGSGNN